MLFSTLSNFRPRMAISIHDRQRPTKKHQIRIRDIFTAHSQKQGARLIPIAIDALSSPDPSHHSWTLAYTSYTNVSLYDGLQLFVILSGPPSKNASILPMLPLPQTYEDTGTVANNFVGTELPRLDKSPLLFFDRYIGVLVTNPKSQWDR